MVNDRFHDKTAHFWLLSLGGSRIYHQDLTWCRRLPENALQRSWQTLLLNLAGHGPMRLDKQVSNWLFLTFAMGAIVWALIAHHIQFHTSSKSELSSCLFFVGIHKFVHILAAPCPAIAFGLIHSWDHHSHIQSHRSRHGCSWWFPNFEPADHVIIFHTYQKQRSW